MQEKQQRLFNETLHRYHEILDGVFSAKKSLLFLHVAVLRAANIKPFSISKIHSSKFTHLCRASLRRKRDLQDML